MSARTISFGIQKGGCGKSTTTGVLAYLMSQDGYKVLSIDMDSQGNLTELLSNQPSNEFVERSVLEAMQYHNARKYIVSVGENLDLLPANNFLATFPRWIYTFNTYKERKMPYIGKSFNILDHLLDQVRDDYDFILIDTPPALSEQTTNALCASDDVVVMYECSKWSYSAIPNFLDSVEQAMVVGNRDTQIVGVLRTLTDARRSDAKVFNELIAEDYPDDVFNTVIKRLAAVGRISLYGFEGNTELQTALPQYESFYKELLDRVSNRK